MPYKHVTALIVLGKLRVRPTAEIRKGYGHNFVMPIDKAEREPDLGTRLAVLRLQIPEPFRFAAGRPPIAYRAARHDNSAAGFVDGHRLPRGARRRRCLWQVALAQVSVRNPTVALLAQPHQHRHVGESPAIILKIWNRPLKKKLFQDDVAHRHSEGAVGALFGVQP